MLYLFIPALAAALLLGFLAGLFSFRVKSRWCPKCGLALRCPACSSVTTYRAVGS